MVGPVTRIDLDPILVLAHTMHTTPDSHAVLLGAGVSMAAGVRTAWTCKCLGGHSEAMTGPVR
jgi:hypothetical protein